MSENSDWAGETEQRVLDEALRLAPREGWTSILVRRAGLAAGLTPPEAELLLPHGPKDLAALLSRRHDAAAMATLAEVDVGALKIREKIELGVQTRIEAAMADEAALRRWVGFLNLPFHLALGARLYWETADAIWRWAGDVATDENHYSKRAILSGLYTSTLAVRLTGGDEAARVHLERGIGAVMRYETFKWKYKGRTKDWASNVAATLGRMRYGRETPPPAA
jgi:ubiquinone biosynthesis protein COQ9